MADTLQFAAGLTFILLPVSWFLLILSDERAESIPEFIFYWFCYFVILLLAVASFALGWELLQEVM